MAIEPIFDCKPFSDIVYRLIQKFKRIFSFLRTTSNTKEFNTISLGSTLKKSEVSFYLCRVYSVLLAEEVLIESQLICDEFLGLFT